MMNTVRDIICAADGMRLTRQVRLLTASLILVIITVATLDDPSIRGNAMEILQLDLICMDGWEPGKRIQIWKLH